MLQAERQGLVLGASMGGPAVACSMGVSYGRLGGVSAVRTRTVPVPAWHCGTVQRLRVVTQVTSLVIDYERYIYLPFWCPKKQHPYLQNRNRALIQRNPPSCRYSWLVGRLSKEPHHATTKLYTQSGRTHGPLSESLPAKPGPWNSSCQDPRLATGPGPSRTLLQALQIWLAHPIIGSSGALESLADSSPHPFASGPQGGVEITVLSRRLGCIR